MFRTESADDLALHSDHAQITLRLIVCKGYDGIISKTADFSLVCLKTVNQSADFSAFHPATLSGFFLRERILCCALFKDLIVIPLQAFFR